MSNAHNDVPYGALRLIHPTLALPSLLTPHSNRSTWTPAHSPKSGGARRSGSLDEGRLCAGLPRARASSPTAVPVRVHRRGLYDELTFAGVTRADLAGQLLFGSVCYVMWARIDVSARVGSVAGLALPVVLAPIGLAGMNARVARFRRARPRKLPASHFAFPPYRPVRSRKSRRATGKPFWFQLYMIRDRAFMKDLLGAGEGRNGCEALDLHCRYAGARLALSRLSVRSGRSIGRVGALRRLRAGTDASGSGHGMSAFCGRPHNPEMLHGGARQVTPGSKISSRGCATTSIRRVTLARARVRCARLAGPLIIKGILDARRDVAGCRYRRRWHRRVEPWWAAARWRVFHGAGVCPRLLMRCGDRLSVSCGWRYPLLDWIVVQNARAGERGRVAGPRVGVCARGRRRTGRNARAEAHRAPRCAVAMALHRNDPSRCDRSVSILVNETGRQRALIPRSGALNPLAGVFFHWLGGLLLGELAIRN